MIVWRIKEFCWLATSQVSAWEIVARMEELIAFNTLFAGDKSLTRNSDISRCAHEEQLFEHRNYNQKSNRADNPRLWACRRTSDLKDDTYMTKYWSVDYLTLICPQVFEREDRKFSYKTVRCNGAIWPIRLQSRPFATALVVCSNPFVIMTPCDEVLQLQSVKNVI